MPSEVKEVFEEARQIFSISPRASAGLLRVCVEKITEELGEKEGTLNARIANLVKRGLPHDVQKALDTVRVIGNNELHTGQINMDDGPETTRSLFDIVNIIVQTMISNKKQVDDMYNLLPKEKLNSITNRDKNDKTA